MSGGEIVVLPAAAVIAPVAAAAVIVVGAGLAAALVIRGAQAGAAATGRALERFGEDMERAANEQDEVAVRTRLWESAASAVVQANQEIHLLAARAERAGVRTPLPSPYDLTGHGLADTRGWALRVEKELDSARSVIERAEAGLEQRFLLAKLAATAGGAASTADLLAHYQDVLATRRRSSARLDPPAVLPPTVDRIGVAAEIDEILARLDIEASAVERQQAITAAARAAKQTSPGASRTFLEALAKTVDERINPVVARRKEAAGLLVALEHPVITEAINETTPLPPYLASIERLRHVVRGDADLTPELWRDAADSLAWAEKAVERRRLLDAMAETFADLGYSVTTGMKVHHTTALSVARDAWRGGHSADVWVDASGGVQWRLVELAPGASNEAGRCQDLNQSMRAVGEELEQRGFDADVQVPDKLIKPVRRHDGVPVPSPLALEETTTHYRVATPDEVEK